ncbi:hypothetical protein ACWEKT_28025 [Nocardia takedensis]
MPFITKGRTMLPAFALSAAALVLGASSAHATDVGGDGNPATDCSGGYTVQSATVYYDFQAVGLVELRWSYACSGNWTRTTSYIGARPLYSQVYLESNPADEAHSWDNATSHFTRYIQVAPSDRVCVRGEINVGGVTARSAEFCSN